MEVNKDDILEFALNYSIESAARKYNVPEALVTDIVRWFKGDIEDDEPCSCEKARMEGVSMMCFMCDKGPGRIQI